MQDWLAIKKKLEAVLEDSWIEEEFESANYHSAWHFLDELRWECQERIDERIV